jgi:hypothetical protein
VLKLLRAFLSQVASRTYEECSCSAGVFSSRIIQFIFPTLHYFVLLLVRRVRGVWGEERVERGQVPLAIIIISNSYVQHLAITAYRVCSDDDPAL